MLIRLFHHKGLGYAAVNKKLAPKLPSSVQSLANENCTVLTFRPLGNGRPDRQLKKLTATDRFTWVVNDHLVFFGLETDTPLAPIILWDCAHAAAIGSRITLIADIQPQSFLERSYFSKSFNLLKNADGSKTFIKISQLPAEVDKGLHQWSFGIPVGPEDATLLNVTVKRILDLDIPEKEILLCGRPGSNFAYFDQVRIVGEDITAPPVKICAKKNRLANEAKYPNLCIIHDRVYLPSNFYEAVLRFGDAYPLTTLQCLFFDDKINLIPRRYSDFGVSYRAKFNISKGMMRDNATSEPSTFSPVMLPQFESSGFFAGSALRYDMGAYPTGSMYICKRSVWQAFPQNENLHWIEFEDIEQAYRAVANGVPSRINPYAITQSIISRPLLGRVSGTFIESMRGIPHLTRPWSEFLPLKRRPAIKASQANALASMQRFIDKYVTSADPLIIPASTVIRSVNRIESIINILSRVQIPLHESSIRQFIADFEKWIMFDQLPFSFIEQACHRMLIDHAHPVQVLVNENEILKNHVANRPKGEIFCTELSDYLQKPSVFLKIGTIFSAIYLLSKRKRIIFLKGLLPSYYQAIINSTPFIK